MSDKEIRDEELEELKRALERANAMQKRAEARRGVDDTPGGWAIFGGCACTVAILGFVAMVFGTCLGV